MTRITRRLIAAGALLVAATAAAQSQPPQPTTGPGGASYPHAGYTVTTNGVGSTQYWVYQPASPRPPSAPLVVFLHGYGAMDPASYVAWLEHLVRRGNVVVYPRYQATLLTPQRFYTDNALTAIRNAITWLRSSPSRVQPDVTRFALVGHSYGGVVTVNVAHRWQSAGLPQPRVVMPVQPYDQYLDALTGIPSSALINCFVGEDDTVVGRSGCDLIWDRTGHVPLTNRDYVVMQTDTHGAPPMEADHYAPSAPATPGQVGETDAYDWYATWRTFDALCACAFSGVSCEYALGNTPQHRGMGTWSDGVAAEELLIFDAKP